jgi:uncharacterized protein (DUF433 family)
MKKVEIIDRGRGPEIAGTRVTVYTIWDYASTGDHHSSIALMLGLSSAQVLAAIEYIEQHKEEVLADYQKILDRAAKGHPPEVQAKVDAIKAKYDVLWADRRKKARENGDARDHGRQ